MPRQRRKAGFKRASLFPWVEDHAGFGGDSGLGEDGVGRVFPHRLRKVESRIYVHSETSDPSTRPGGEVVPTAGRATSRWLAGSALEPDSESSSLRPGCGPSYAGELWRSGRSAFENEAGQQQVVS